MAKTWDYYSGQARKRLTPLVESGEAVCLRCKRVILPGTPWDVGHIISIDVDASRMDDPTNQGPEHRRCNRAAGARYRNRKHNRQRPTQLPAPSRDW